MLATTGESKSTFSSVLSTLFKEEGLQQDIQVQEVSEGYLCKICRGSVSNLDRLQHKVKGVESSIISLLKRSSYTENGGMENKVNCKKGEEVEDEENMEVEALISKRIGRGKKTEYLVKWKNYDRIEYNTWELA